MQMPPSTELAQNFVWPLPVEACASNDLDAFLRKLEAVAARRGFRRESLGEAFGTPLWLLTREPPGRDRPSLLIAAGFHGEEPAGPWAVLRFLDQCDEALLDTARLGVLPLVNASGFSAGQRHNAADENPNRGFAPDEDGIAPSAEGRLLLACADRIAALGRDGVLACHEDALLDCAYVYVNESGAHPGSFGKALRDANARYFPLHPDGSVDGCPIRDGIVFNHRDSSFESWLMRLGAARSACIETPGQASIERRILAQVEMIATFVRVCATGDALGEARARRPGRT